jgi:hypothetical protein
MSINWYVTTDLTMGRPSWILSCMPMGNGNTTSCYEHGEIIMVSDSDYRWSHQLFRTSSRVRGDETTLKDAVDAVERQLTTLNGHQRIALGEVREAAGLPL